MIAPNPFALARASDYTDKQINSLWVEIGSATVNRIIDPRSPVSKYILGGKGTGKTHLLRYHSYQVSRQRDSKLSGVNVLKKYGYLAIFLRATGLDASRFEAGDSPGMQHLFGVYLELKLAEILLDALCDVKCSSPECRFDDDAFVRYFAQFVRDDLLADCSSIESFREWVTNQRRMIDDAVNNAAFTGRIDVRVPFKIGSLALPIRVAIGMWSTELAEIPLIYMIDEIENFNASQQEVVNSLIRYGEGLATFRVTGRLYGIKTYATLAMGEENREGAEIKTTKLDEILREYQKYPEFARKFVSKRLAAAGVVPARQVFKKGEFDPRDCFDELDSEELYAKTIDALGLDSTDQTFLRRFDAALAFLIESGRATQSDLEYIKSSLTQGMPPILARLNVLIFCKKLSKSRHPTRLAESLMTDAVEFAEDRRKSSSYYRTAYGHWAGDLFAQLCRDSKATYGVPYAGFDFFVKMSSGNPRNLLVILGRIYEIAEFKGLDFVNGPKVSIAVQTEGAKEAARFMYESDTNYGSDSDLARRAVERLAILLRTARYSLSIPEVSPLAVSFANADVSEPAMRVLHAALNYSYVFEVSEGRPDRNNQGLNRKIQLNPLLSPKWELPIGRRGDLSLSKDLVNAIFNPDMQEEFEIILRRLDAKWNNPFQKIVGDMVVQPGLF
ncbi:hypothetical protein DF133_29800 [Burkholderia cenocepacia]|nr:hypothetical protein DF133_29800 [Burkholderia cenocepacia]